MFENLLDVKLRATLILCQI